MIILFAAADGGVRQVSVKPPLQLVATSQALSAASTVIVSKPNSLSNQWVPFLTFIYSFTVSPKFNMPSI